MTGEDVVLAVAWREPDPDEWAAVAWWDDCTAAGAREIERERMNDGD